MAFYPIISFFFSILYVDDTLKLTFSLVIGNGFEEEILSYTYTTPVVIEWMKINQLTKSAIQMRNLRNNNVPRTVCKNNIGSFWCFDESKERVAIGKH